MSHPEREDWLHQHGGSLWMRRDGLSVAVIGGGIEHDFWRIYRLDR
jgi:hypothetical protein